MSDAPHPTVPLFKQRAALADELRLLGYDFVREPTMALANQMRALRDQISDIERRVVKTRAVRDLLDLAREGELALANLDEEGGMQ